ncbi:MAG TPA: 4-hydroxythreonine-4-phosphate dehydrogenase PdxA, partial [bacterium]|nr:4-hydroxythreonine-4-phosphate dehydrogenase PdxA [bacterium]
SIKVAVDMAMHGLVQGIVTGPICKQSLQLAGCPHAGHTELLAELGKVKRTVMMLANAKLRVVLVTTHIPLKDVAKEITCDHVLETIEITTQTFQRFGWGTPRLGVLGLNPHSGEQGTIGTEEDVEIIPAVTEARRRGCVCLGPIPADTAFHRALNGEFDVVVAMYHDQGIGPLKTLSFSDVINVTLGLPFIRVSPGHGTAFDISGTGTANPASMKLALETAVDLCARMPTESSDK